MPILPGGSRIGPRRSGMRSSARVPASPDLKTGLPAIRLARLELSERLRLQKAQIEQAVQVRLDGDLDAQGRSVPTDFSGARVASSAMVEYAIAVVEYGERRLPPVPPAVLDQTRQAARRRTGIDVIMRQLLAGHAVLIAFLVDAVEQCDHRANLPLKSILGDQAIMLDRLTDAIAAEYNRDLSERPVSEGERRSKRIQRLLNGELLDEAGLDYDLNGHHVGAVLTGPGAIDAARRLAESLDRRLLLARRERTVWAWFGGQATVDREELDCSAENECPAGVAIALGEPAFALEGWRLTHKQARAAMPIASQTPGSPVRYRSVALLASMLRDDLLKRSLEDLYLVPLREERDGGLALRDTLRMYFAVNRNATSTAAALGVSRQTVVHRLQLIEKRLERPLATCAAEVDAALQLDELGDIAL
jgi:hypothetical protein